MYDSTVLFAGAHCEASVGLSSNHKWKVGQSMMAMWCCRFTAEEKIPVFTSPVITVE